MKLSIITINYNNCEGLRKTIDSVISQTWQDFEWIIVDGGSTDGSCELIEQTAAQLEAQGWTTEQFSGPEDPAAYIADNQPSINDPSSIDNSSFSHRLLWCSEKDKGVYNAMNKGIVHSIGKYIIFMNSGDTFDHAKTLFSVFAENLVGDVVYGDWIQVFSDHEVLKKSPEAMFQFLVFFENVCHQAMLVRGDLQRSKLYDESFRALADWKMWIDFSLENRSFQYIPIIVCRFESENGITATNNQCVNIEKERILQDSTLPYSLKKFMQSYSHNLNRYRFYEDCILTHQTFDLVRERKLYQWMIHLNLWLITVIKKIIDSFS